MPNANYIDEWRWLSVPLPAIYSLGDPNYHHTWRTKYTGCRGKRHRGERGALQKKKEKKNESDLMLVDITSLYYHHFMVPTKLIESAPPPYTESSLLLAGPPSLHFFFWNTTLHICHMIHSNTHPLHNEAHLHNFISNLAHTDKSHIIHVYWFYVCVLENVEG